MNCSKLNLSYNEELNDAIGRIQVQCLLVDSIA